MGNKGSSNVQSELEGSPEWQSFCSWATQNTGIPVQKMDDIRDGVVLCLAMQAVQPSLMPKFNQKPADNQFQILDNLQSFLRAAKNLGVSERTLFNAEDLAKMNNLAQVLGCVNEFQNLASLQQQQQQQQQLALEKLQQAEQQKQQEQQAEQEQQQAEPQQKQKQQAEPQAKSPKAKSPKKQQQQAAKQQQQRAEPQAKSPKAKSPKKQQAKSPQKPAQQASPAKNQTPAAALSQLDQALSKVERGIDSQEQRLSKLEQQKQQQQPSPAKKTGTSAPQQKKQQKSSSEQSSAQLVSDSFAAQRVQAAQQNLLSAIEVASRQVDQIEQKMRSTPQQAAAQQQQQQQQQLAPAQTVTLRDSSVSMWMRRQLQSQASKFQVRMSVAPAAARVYGVSSSSAVDSSSSSSSSSSLPTAPFHHHDASDRSVATWFLMRQRAMPAVTAAPPTAAASTASPAAPVRSQAGGASDQKKGKKQPKQNKQQGGDATSVHVKASKKTALLAPASESAGDLAPTTPVPSSDPTVSIFRYKHYNLAPIRFRQTSQPASSSSSLSSSAPRSAPLWQNDVDSMPSEAESPHNHRIDVPAMSFVGHSWDSSVSLWSLRRTTSSGSPA